MQLKLREMLLCNVKCALRHVDLFHFTSIKARYFTKGDKSRAESKLRDLSIEFAVEIIKFCEGIKGHYLLVNQLERSATSIGANIKEANYPHGKADFIPKLQIALKECFETELNCLKNQKLQMLIN